MTLVVNNSERAITIIDVLLSPGVPTDIQDAYLKHPGVQSLLKQLTEHKVPVLAIVEEESSQKETVPIHKTPTKAELLAEAQE
jgi:hypothetical protein